MAAALSDVLDGIVARLLKQESALGVALDPIADKILMTTGYLTLSFRGALPWGLTIIVLSRDVAILATALLICLVAGYRPFHRPCWGKHLPQHRWPPSSGVVPPGSRPLHNC